VERVNDKLGRLMRASAEDVFRTHDKHDVALRCAAYVKALERLERAINAYGTQSHYLGGAG
jgi:glutamate dehydrogenase/leucine dehydrogenase